MAFGFAGAGAGASDALQELLIQAFRQKQAEQELALRQQSERTQSEQGARHLTLQENENTANQAYRQNQMDRQAAQDRAASNTRGVRRMMGDYLMQRGGQPLDQGARNQLEGMAISEGVELPKTMLEDPNLQHTQRMEEIAATGQNALRVANVRAADTPSGQEWVTRNGQVIPIPKGTAQPGDTPFDAVAARASAAAQPSSDAAKYAADRAQRSIDSAKSLLNKVSGWNTGLGNTMAKIPGTDARNFAAELKTLQSNIAFSELAAMRNASKTGGALGAVSERELALLESTLGALDPGQSPENLRMQLKQVVNSLTRWKQAQYGIDMSGEPPPGAGGAGASQYQVGQTVTLRDGRTVMIKKINPDGTFEY